MTKRIDAPVSLFILASLAGCQTTSEPEAADTIIAGGQVFDGSGVAGRNADIAIRDGMILYIGPDASSRYSAKNTVNANGLIVAPGFIDPHTHAGSDLASDTAKRRANLPFAFQGVTTVVIGNDGGGKPEIAALAQAARADGIGTNAAYLVGFGSVREAVLAKENRAPSQAELAKMKSITRTAMCEGAWGFSAGLYYVPQSYSQTDEVVALAKIAGEAGGYFDTHMRDESTYNVTVTGAVAETLEIGRRANLPVHIAHIKALGPAVWGHSARMIAMIEEAQAAGQRVTADQYPWEASGTRISSALVPRKALEGGLPALRVRLGDPAQLAVIRTGIATAIERRGGADRLLITGQLSGSDAPVGKTLAQLAELRELSPADAAIEVLRKGDARLASFNMSAEDIAAFASQEWVVTGSDGSNGHPRKYGSFPKAYRDLVQGEAQMSLARFIRRSSGKTADIIGIDRRGYLKVDYHADVVIFDPSAFAPNADYSAPRKLSSGVAHLYVNGVPVITGGSYTGALPGEPLLKDTQC
ncbi:N-acyl-D-amino-acid deacylase family protein [Erythrobacter crassostreae]|uniref:Amidohydrolase family protein n=1 Tax=Erythrobacter crassostreae TaxID=2828328 RepID=A0A9X1JNB5_9SPHN|nr:amidohydrolase family protein [Erythrobacter crassostrea]MBV7260289.1 amidohydrolase family protein [Erythrobacter crassostrea]